MESTAMLSARPFRSSAGTMSLPATATAAGAARSSAPAIVVCRAASIVVITCQRCMSCGVAVRTTNCDARWGR
jgi:hypothetical protein